MLAIFPLLLVCIVLANNAIWFYFWRKRFSASMSSEHIHTRLRIKQNVYDEYWILIQKRPISTNSTTKFQLTLAFTFGNWILNDRVDGEKWKSGKIDTEGRQKVGGKVRKREIETEWVRNPVNVMKSDRNSLTWNKRKEWKRQRQRQRQREVDGEAEEEKITRILVKLYRTAERAMSMTARNRTNEKSMRTTFMELDCSLSFCITFKILFAD